jgi:hypothetical protein
VEIDGIRVTAIKMNLIRPKVMKGIIRSFISIGLVAVSLIVQPVWAAEESNDEWKFNGGLYLWASDIDMEDSSGDNSTISFNEIVNNLDLVFMGHLGGQKGRLGFTIDAIYLDMSETERDHVAPGIIHDKTEIQSTIITPIMTYRVVEDNQFNLDVLGGMRYLYMDVNLKFNVLDDLGDDGSVYNGVVGFRGKAQLNKNWSLPFYYDIGKGDSELTYQAFAGARYGFSSFDLSAGYRYMKFKFDDDDDFGGVLNNLVIKGPMVGGRYWF